MRCFDGGGLAMGRCEMTQGRSIASKGPYPAHQHFTVTANIASRCHEPCAARPTMTRRQRLCKSSASCRRARNAHAPSSLTSAGGLHFAARRTQSEHVTDCRAHASAHLSRLLQRTASTTNVQATGRQSRPMRDGLIVPSHVPDVRRAGRAGQGEVAASSLSSAVRPARCMKRIAGSLAGQPRTPSRTVDRCATRNSRPPVQLCRCQALMDGTTAAQGMTGGPWRACGKFFLLLRYFLLAVLASEWPQAGDGRREATQRNAAHVLWATEQCEVAVAAA